MTAPDAGPRGGRARGWALVASVALNLFLIGWIAGGWTRGAPPPHGPMLERLHGRLTAEGYARVAADITAMDREMAGLGKRFDAARAALIAAVSATPYDAAALSAVLATISAERRDEDGRMSERLATVLGKLDTSDRVGLVETLFGALPPPR